MQKIVILTRSEIELWDNIGQSPSAIEMGGHTWLGYTNEFIFAEDEQDLVKKMQEDIDSGECYNYGGGGSLRDWAIGKYNLT